MLETNTGNSYIIQFYNIKHYINKHVQNCEVKEVWGRNVTRDTKDEAEREQSS